MNRLAYITGSFSPPLPLSSFISIFLFSAPANGRDVVERDDDSRVTLQTADGVTVVTVGGNPPESPPAERVVRTWMLGGGENERLAL